LLFVIYDDHHTCANMIVIIFNVKRAIDDS